MYDERDAFFLYLLHFLYLPLYYKTFYAKLWAPPYTIVNFKIPLIFGDIRISLQYSVG